MSSARAARLIATAAVYGGGGLSVLGASAFALLYAEAKLARRAIGWADDIPPEADGTYGRQHAAPGRPPLQLVVLGDSTAASYGTERAEETMAAMLASGLAALAEREVRLRVLAEVGARSEDLAAQLERALEQVPHPDVALVIVGANDVTKGIRPSESVRMLDAGVRSLLATGCQVVVGTCPDLGTIEPIAPPLRWVARRWSRQLAAAQTVAVVEAGGRTVSIATLLAPEFAAAPGELFGHDRFHPSATGYATGAAVMLPSLAAAAGLIDEPSVDPIRGEALLPVSLAAARAVEQPGTEVTVAQVSGEDRSRRGRWSALRYRRRSSMPNPVGPARGSPVSGDEATEVGQHA